MKIEYYNLYTHFILITKNRLPVIAEKNRERIEKYITGTEMESELIRLACYSELVTKGIRSACLASSFVELKFSHRK